MNLPEKFEMPDDLPTICRLVSINRTVSGDACNMSAELFFGGVSHSVSWESRHPDIRLHSGAMVSPRAVCFRSVASDGSRRVGRVVLLERTERSLNLFETIPERWVADRPLVSRAAALWEGLPLPFQELINALLWDGRRMELFCRGPSSLDGPHAEANGNFRHAVETAETIQALMPLFPTANPAVAIMAGFMHDLAKSEFYRPRQNGGWKATDWGWKVSPRDTLLLWIGEVIEKLRCPLSRSHRQALLHAITASCNLPPDTRSDDALSPEAVMLSLANRVSEEGDFCARGDAVNDQMVGRGRTIEMAVQCQRNGNGTQRRGMASLDNLYSMIQEGRIVEKRTEKLCF